VSELQVSGVTERRGDSAEAQNILSRQGFRNLVGEKAGQNESSFTLGACFASDLDK
jgi:hypothetical protein